MKQYIENTIEVIKSKYKDLYWMVPFVLLALWILDTIFSMFNTGFIKIDILFIVLILGKLGILAYNLIIFQNLFIKGNLDYYPRFQTYTGYMVVFIYVFYSLPRLSWEIQGFINEDVSLRLWIFSFISSFIVFLLYWVLRFSKTQLNWKVITQEHIDEKKSNKKSKKKVKTTKTMKEHIVENIHVIVQAIISVIIIQHFTIQLYEIPTESMVPTFLIKDRVLVSKLQQGPTIPLTNWHFPTISKLKRGDIVIFESPFYQQDNVLKKIFHEFIFYLTLSSVNIDRDEDGEIRKKLIVKRLIGMPGEKIKMIDDVVYIKKQGEQDFKALESIKGYAHVDLYNEPRETAKKIQTIPITSDTRKILKTWDDWKDRITISELNNELQVLADQFDQKIKSIDLNAMETDFFKKLLSITYPDYKNDYVRMQNFLKNKDFDYYQDIGSLISRLNPQFLSQLKRDYFRPIFGYDYLLFWDLLQNSMRINEFRQFLLSTVGDKTYLRDFEENGRKFSLRLKILLAKRFNLFMDLYLENPVDPDVNSSKTEIQLDPNAMEYSELFIYLQIYYDKRNFPEFPPDKFISKGEYFLMGDNRYNSLDFRYSHEENKPFIKLDQHDQYSVVYQSSLDMHLLEQGKILGIGVLRVWPPERMSTFK